MLIRIAIHQKGSRLRRSHGSTAIPVECRWRQVRAMIQLFVRKSLGCVGILHQPQKVPVQVQMALVTTYSRRRQYARRGAPYDRQPHST